MDKEYQGGAMSEEYEEVRDRSNKLVMRLEAFDAAEVEEIEMKWLIGEVCHLRGAYITNSFRLRDERARAEKAEAEYATAYREWQATANAWKGRAERLAAWMRQQGHVDWCEGECTCGLDAALADEPGKEGS